MLKGEKFDAFALPLRFKSILTVIILTFDSKQI